MVCVRVCGVCVCVYVLVACVCGKYMWCIVSVWGVYQCVGCIYMVYKCVCVSRLTGVVVLVPNSNSEPAPAPG